MGDLHRPSFVPRRSSLDMKPQLRSTNSCIFTIKHGSDLFQTVTLGFGEEDESDGKEDTEQDAKDNVVVPTDVVESDGIDECKDDQRTVDREQFNSQTLTTESIGEDFSWVTEEERCICYLSPSVRGFKRTLRGNVPIS